MAGYFAAIVRAPITGIILISEMTGTLSNLLSLSLVSLTAYLTAELLGGMPVYEQLLQRMLQGSSHKKPKRSNKVFVESQVQIGSFMDGKTLSEIGPAAGQSDRFCAARGSGAGAGRTDSTYERRYTRDSVP